MSLIRQNIGNVKRFMEEYGQAVKKEFKEEAKSRSYELPTGDRPEVTTAPMNQKLVTNKKKSMIKERKISMMIINYPVYLSELSSKPICVIFLPPSVLAKDST